MNPPGRPLDPAPSGTPKGLRPRDAATLIVVDRSDDTPRILMGRRRHDLAFMPSKYVFPGGRRDPADATAPSGDAMPDALSERLLSGMRGRPSTRRARALALTAVRETFEETGVLIGRRGTAASHDLPQIWKRFIGHGIVPHLSDLRFVARAITPPGRTRRFDTRFFMADASAIGHRLPLDSAPDGELEDISWLTFKEARNADLPYITHVILDVIETGIKARIDYDRHPAVPFFYMRHGRFIQDTV